MDNMKSTGQNTEQMHEVKKVQRYWPKKAKREAIHSWPSNIPQQAAWLFADHVEEEPFLETPGKDSVT